MTLYLPPSRDEHLRFLASFLFGGAASPTLREAVWRAYLDLSRTVHGIDASDPSKRLRGSAHELVETLVAELLATPARAQRSVDAWHRAACAALGEHFARGGFTTFAVGQSQKWLNMTIKYALTLAAVGWLDVPEAQHVRAVAHAPIDSFFLAGLARTGQEAPAKLSAPWSRITDYDEYLTFQRWLRKSVGCPPLDVEFHVWQEISAKRRALAQPRRPFPGQKRRASRLEHVS